MWKTSKVKQSERERSKKKRNTVKIVFYMPICSGATLFNSEYQAIEAAAEQSKQRGYECEHFFCEREHTFFGRNNRVSAAVGWHVRSVRWH
jgi:hypothetical protein